MWGGQFFDRSRSMRQPLNDRAAGWVAEGREESIERMVSHIPN